MNKRPLNPGDIIIYWRDTAARSLAIAGSVNEVNILPSMFTCTKEGHFITVLRAQVHISLMLPGVENEYSSDGTFSADVVRESCEAFGPIDRFYPVSAIFRPPSWKMLPPPFTSSEESPDVCFRFDGCRFERHASGLATLIAMTGDKIQIL
jgi:hypothetical protein